MKRISVLTSTTLLFYILSMTRARSQQCSPSPIVNTTLGPVQGCERKTKYNGMQFFAYKGIRYAAPPIGNLRFQPPQPATPWTQVYNASEERSQCVQYDAFFKQSHLGDEDCLFLNVYTPQVPVNTNNNITRSNDSDCNRCVMVWIYGGSFYSGYKDEFLYAPDLLLEDQCVIVAMNYRLGAFGFLNLAIKESSGNQGMKDQVMALKWVQDNIAKFCGDPNNVTLFGQSAGGSSVILHAMSSMSIGLFNGYISQSGSPLFLSQTSEWAHTTAKKLGRKMGFDASNNTVLWQQLMNASAWDIGHAQYILYLNLPSDTTLAFMPSVEDAPGIDPSKVFLSKSAWISLFTGQFRKYPCMIGHTENELIAFLYHLLNSLGLPIIHNTAFHYSAAALAKVISALTFTASIQINQRLLAQYSTDKPVYYYLLKYNKYPKHVVETVPINVTTHCDDFGMIFSSCQFGVTSCDDPNIALFAFRKTMVKLWTNFAKFGNPTPADNNPIDIIWKPSGLLGEKLILDEPFKMEISL